MFIGLQSIRASALLLGVLCIGVSSCDARGPSVGPTNQSTTTNKLCSSNNLTTFDLNIALLKEARFF
jgi:hypothetical protein